MKPRFRLIWQLTLLVALASVVSAQSKPKPPKSLRLYIFNCGVIHATSAENYSLKKEEVARLDLSVPCFLIAHPKGTMIWDTGVIPDNLFKPGGGEVSTGVSTSSTPLLAQLAAVGYQPSDITYLALSHYHGDHVSNANLFAGSTWIVAKTERDAMFGDPPPARADPKLYSAVKNSKAIELTQNEYDVFNDGSVIIKAAPGHTPGHQVLFLKLKKTGPILIAGDLYHYPEERKLNRLPVRDNQEQTAASRAAVEAFMKKTGAKLWIEHDYDSNAKLKKAPQFYE
jgi:N-acyl homoserine lactone hydrolase